MEFPVVSVVELSPPTNEMLGVTRYRVTPWCQQSCALREQGHSCDNNQIIISPIKPVELWDFLFFIPEESEM
jgi:hypothetical protein